MPPFEGVPSSSAGCRQGFRRGASGEVASQPVAALEGDDDLPFDPGAHGGGGEDALERCPVEAVHGAHVGVSNSR